MNKSHEQIIMIDDDQYEPSCSSLVIRPNIFENIANDKDEKNNSDWFDDVVCQSSSTIFRWKTPNRL